MSALSEYLHGTRNLLGLSPRVKIPPVNERPVVYTTRASTAGTEASSRMEGQPSSLTDFSDRDISQDKYARYVGVDVPSFEKVKPHQLQFGDIYLTQTNSGDSLSILPMYVNNWTAHHGFLRNWLLILAFDGNNNVVGTRSVKMTFKDQAVESEGYVASVRCGEGVASALEEVRTRSQEELLMKFRQPGLGKNVIHHRIGDDNREVLNRLRDMSAQNPQDIFVAARYHHALEDRPRWETLFSPEHGRRGQHGMNIWIYPVPEAANRGFSTDSPTVFAMEKVTAEGRKEWEFEDLGAQSRNEFENRGLFDITLLKRQLRESTHRAKMF